MPQDINRGVCHPSEHQPFIHLMRGKITRRRHSPKNLSLTRDKAVLLTSMDNSLNSISKMPNKDLKNYRTCPPDLTTSYTVTVRITLSLNK
jgi:hypothetical protein